MKRKASRIVRVLGTAAAALAVLMLGSFALPISTWRTGELPAPPLPLVKGGPPVNLAARIWIDTDAGCGHAWDSDPDDCFALLLLARAGADIVGISTVHGNAPLDATDRIARELVAALARSGYRAPPVFRGSEGPAEETGATQAAPAHAALQRALADGKLTVIALGPLTNIAAALRGRPDLAANLARLVTVMGRRPGHVFHPAEGRGDGILFGHGPVFRDFNFDKDRAAAAAVLRMNLPLTLVPYDAARQVLLDEAALARLAAADGAGAWVAARAKGWLDYWKKIVGLNGFYPFDALAAAYALEPKLFDCAEVPAWIAKDRRLWGGYFNPVALLAGVESERPERTLASARAIYCPRIDPDMQAWLVSRMTAPGRVPSRAKDAR